MRNGIGRKLKFRFFGSRKKFFLPKEEMPEDSASAYDNQFAELDADAEQVEDILGDISGGGISDELTAARLDNLKMRTAVLQQKLDEQKQEIWSEWNEKFFNIFAESFGKFKNDLISLHLGEEQLNILNDKLDSALKIMKDKLDTMWLRYKNEEEEQEK